MSWQSILDVVQLMTPHVDAIPPGDIRTRAGTLAVNTFGERTLNQPALVNFAALTLLIGRLVVHRLTADAAGQVRSTELRSVPGEPPSLMRRPWIIESRRPERYQLFGQTASLAGYELDGRYYLIGLDYPDGVHVEPVRIAWQEHDLSATTTNSPLVEGDIREHRQWAEQAAEWIVTLGALLDAESTPLESEDWEPKGKRRSRRQSISNGGEDGWSVRRVSLTRTASARVSDRTGDLGPTEREGMTLSDTWVRGHLRRQPYGPGRELRRWVYIERYEARRWVTRRPLRIEVGAGD